MADNEEIIWPVEAIPETDKLYMRVHRSYVHNGDFVPGAFRDHGGGMSTDWEKYATPIETKNRCANPNDNGVIEMVSGNVAAVPGLTVVHTPDVQRRIRAHVDVVGDKKAPEVRVKLKRIASWVIGCQLN